MSQRIFLKIFKNDSVDKIIQRSASQEQISIGHDPEVDVCLTDEENISPWHALIEKRGSEYFASDLGSSQGTLLNGEELLDSVIQHGDSIQIGIYRVEFYVGSPYVSKKGVASKIVAQKKEKVSTPQRKTKPRTSSKVKPPTSTKKKASGAKTQDSSSSKKNSSVSSRPKIQASSSLKKKSSLRPRLKKPIVQKEIEEEFIEDENLQEVLDNQEEEIIDNLEEKFVKDSEQELIEEVDDESKEDLEESNKRGSPSPFQMKFNPAWKRFIPRKVSPKTFAPPSAIKNLDETISPGSGTDVEVIVAWKDRILAVHHSSTEETITIGSSKESTIQIPNLVNKSSYSLIHCGQVAQISLMNHMTGKIITRKRSVDFNFAAKKGIISSKSPGLRVLSLGQNEVVRVNLHPNLRVYIRYSSKTAKPEKGFFFDFSESELIGIGISVCLMLLLFFYVGVYLPSGIEDEEMEKETRFATIVLKPPSRPRVTQVRKAVKQRPARTRQKAPKVSRKQPTIRRSGKAGRLGGVKSNPKPKPKSKPRATQITSARSGGSGIKSKKSGSTGKSPQVNPNEVGLLGVFGKSGVKKQLDKAQSGSGVLAGLADRNSGYSGNQEAYSGEGIGTKFKSSGSSGKGSSLVGISKISTKGRGGGTSGFGRGGNLGTRGRLNLSFGAAETDVAGGINRDAIDRVLKQNQPQLKACHSMVLQSDSSATGRLSVDVSIVSDKVVATGIKRNQSGSQRLANCVMNRIRNWRFPGAVSAGDKGIVTFHFVFNR